MPADNFQQPERKDEVMRERHIAGILNGCEQLLEAAQKGAIAQVDRLLSRGVSPDCKDEKGKTPLIKASAAGNAAMAAVLLRHNADVNAVDDIGYTALMAAAFNGHMDVVKILVANGADLAKRNQENLTASEAAEEMGFTEIATYLSAQEAASSTRSQTSEEPDDFGPTTDTTAGASLPFASATATSPAPPSYVQELDLESLPELERSPYFKPHQEPEAAQEEDVNETETEGTGEGDKVDSGPSETSVAPEPEISAQTKTSKESTEAVMEVVRGKSLNTAAGAAPFEMFKNGVFDGVYKSTVDQVASNIRWIIIATIFQAYLIIGYYLLAVFFDNDESQAFSKNPYKETSINDLPSGTIFPLPDRN
jgi:uncharacterized protein